MIDTLRKQLGDYFQTVLFPGTESEPAWLALREELLQLIVIGGSILGALVLLPSAVLTVMEGKWGVAVLDFIIYEWILSLLLFRQYLSYKIRAYSLCLLVYLLGVMILVQLGPLRPGLIYLFCFQVFAAVLLGARAAVYAGLLNVLGLTAIGVMLHLGMMDMAVPLDRPVFRWSVIGANFLLASIIVAAIITAVGNGMNRALRMQKVSAAIIKEKAQAQMRANQALEASEKQFAMALQGSLEGLWDWNLQTRSVAFSLDWKRMLGYSKFEIGNTMDEFIGRVHPEEQGRMSALFEGLKAKDGADSFERKCRMRLKNGEYNTFWVRGHVQRDDQGNMLRVLGSQTNLTQMNRAEAALKESEDNYRALVEQSLQGVAIFSLDPPEMMYVNPSLSRMLGYSPSELKKLPFDRLKQWLHPGDQHSLQGAVERLLARKPVPPLMEYRLKDRDGSLIWLEVSSSRIRYQGKDAMLTTALDVTQKKAAEQERAELEEKLRQLEKKQAFGEAAGGVVMDVSGYLGPIIKRAEAVEQKLPPDHPARTDLREICKMAREAADLAIQVSEVQTLSKREGASVNVVRIVDESVQSIQSEAREHVRIKRLGSYQCRTVRGDHQGIRQMIYALCSRAWKAAAVNEGEMTVLLEEARIGPADLAPDSLLNPGVYLRLSVSHPCRGNEPEIPLKVYSPLVFKDVPCMEGNVDLLLIQSIVKRHDGEFQVSCKPNKGFTYSIVIPLEGAPEEARRVLDIGALPAGNERILMVDDEKPILDMTRQTLERLGYQVTALTSAAGAWEKFQENPGKFDIVITDYNMPGMTGDKLAQNLFSLRPQIPVIMCTGFSEKFSESLARELGIVEYVTKPVLMQEFAHTIRKVLDGPQDAPGLHQGGGYDKGMEKIVQGMVNGRSMAKI
ncbi:putative PAS/PAC sensor protein [Desulfatibacillum aliphaticivorans]|uniref:histidine kinase n=1 Tax=Desulfatibacillum aliphaticivorans TaxID=218208 RepID=B8F9P1_DESAL|nr:PAS domain-containing protein [Desulfatibacillum aliphaticivorans]ACL02987.1 putative PAS/PAC sensor protein [Desulfatibacillum aliphaticivorans]